VPAWVVHVMMLFTPPCRGMPEAGLSMELSVQRHARGRDVNGTISLQSYGCAWHWRLPLGLLVQQLQLLTVTDSVCHTISPRVKCSAHQSVCLCCLADWRC